ncbi:toll/interleukin-1 receptor domain-containing protein [Anaerosporobacter faecicola]|uniref:toll/interleukin-1 receptor domain-containing protein n=1 Tax=Anaerosporobacter faecicola TaxID=2718714 RepID=UPI00143BE2E6|nr:toll/interleukin-1 receptor domain-containing protein [Anaerosporobacter faecicola]
MEIERKIKQLEKLLEKANRIRNESSSDPEFKTWKNSVERTLVQIFGRESMEYEQFSKLKFYFPAMIITSSSDYTSEHLECFRRDMKILKDSIAEYIEELKEESEITPVVAEAIEQEAHTSKIFISHASKDAEIVEEVIELLETIGLESNQIFCTSFDGYGIDLGENFLDTIKEELSADSLVLFILSKNFYNSSVCMCEMGAAWVLSKEHIPILVPPFTFKDIEGVIPLTQGFKIDDPLKLNLLKDKIEKDFDISNKLSISTWERKRDRICNRIEKVLQKSEIDS